VRAALSDELRAKLARVELLVMDVDGVLTDGTLCYGEDGEQLKNFHVHDGLGLRLLRNQGIHVAVITARESAPLVSRMRDLGVEHVSFGTSRKGIALESLASKLGLDMARIAFVGDDLMDIPALRRAGLAITVNNGHPLVRELVDWVTETPGGHGAVREIADALLDARGALRSACEQLLTEIDPGGPGLP